MAYERPSLCRPPRGSPQANASIGASADPISGSTALFALAALAGVASVLYLHARSDQNAEEARTAQGRAFYAERAKARERSRGEEVPLTSRSGRAVLGPAKPSIADRPLSREEAARVRERLSPTPPLRPDALPEVEYVPHAARLRGGLGPSRADRAWQEMIQLRQSEPPTSAAESSSWMRPARR